MESTDMVEVYQAVGGLCLVLWQFHQLDVAYLPFYMGLEIGN